MEKDDVLALKDEHSILKYLEYYCADNKNRNDDIGLLSNFFLKFSGKQFRSDFSINNDLSQAYNFIRYCCYQCIKNKDLTQLNAEIGKEDRQFRKDLKDSTLSRLTDKIFFFVLVALVSNRNINGSNLGKLQIIENREFSNSIKGAFVRNQLKLKTKITDSKQPKDIIELAICSSIYYNSANNSNAEIERHENTVSHYKIISELTEDFQYSVSKDLTPETLLSFITVGLIMKSNGYESGIYIPYSEKINYLANILGKENITKILFHRFKDIISIVEIKNSRVHILLMWVLLFGSILGGIIIFTPEIGNFILNVDLLKPIFSNPIIMFFIGGITMYLIIYFKTKEFEKKMEKD